MSVKVDLSKELNIQAGVSIYFEAKYSDSILMGFHYKNERQHPAYDYVLEVLKQLDLPGIFIEGLTVTQDLDKAFEYTADKVYDAYVNHLSTNKSGYDTLNWWFRDWEPSKKITKERGIF